MRGLAWISAMAVLVPVAGAAQEPVVAVECLCIEKEHGWVIARSDGTMEGLGLNWPQSGSTIVRFTAAENGCTRYASLCSDERYQPMTGEVRSLYQSYGVSEAADDFKLTIQADVARE
ncbi:MAG: hypothetical protein ACREEV_12120 [Dongiaceae bacterium]